MSSGEWWIKVCECGNRVDITSAVFEHYGCVVCALLAGVDLGSSSMLE